MNETSASASTNLAPPPKRKRSLPGKPDPEAEVIALSPKSLLATNRFVCDICNKGFQRDQNLQLHRRGHNVPWKLKQRTSEVVRKKVYVCPELTCVHHDPSRALGDLTGIKKHFCRKHGEKRWKCERCSKRYAVQSDWKAHSKICGTREYRCDCGTLFSRRDSFITHRAFCDALAQESGRAITATNSLVSPQTQLHSQGIQSLKREEELQPWLACNSPLNLSSSHLFSTNLDHHDQNPSPNTNPDSTLLLPPFQPAASPHMSATALLQKAAQMGVTMSKPSLSPTAVSCLGVSSRDEMGSGSHAFALASFGNKAAAAATAAAAVTSSTSRTGFIEHNSLLHDMMSMTSLPCSSGLVEGSSFEEDYHRMMMMNPKREGGFQDALSKASKSINGGGGNDGLTRDFLGVGARAAFSHKDFLNMAAFDYINPSSTTYSHQHNQNQPPFNHL
ncbi:protein indeterminate-domain 11-like [Corylus avellana]|uniref:protein indeterminate-domain 11-like n=1 Tax=Corylus avellana TaxID=13451 RepID=UPI00286B1733|nr:protein indeterminate-domain 11-like [Corylus avellana]